MNAVVQIGDLCLFVVFSLVGASVKSKFTVATSSYGSVPLRKTVCFAPFIIHTFLYLRVGACAYVSILIVFNEHVLILSILFSSMFASNGRTAAMYHLSIVVATCCYKCCAKKVLVPCVSGGIGSLCCTVMDVSMENMHIEKAALSGFSQWQFLIMDICILGIELTAKPNGLVFMQNACISAHRRIFVYNHDHYTKSIALCRTLM